MSKEFKPIKKFDVRYYINAQYGAEGEMCQEYFEQEVEAPEHATIENVATQIKQAGYIYINKKIGGKDRLTVINRSHITHFIIDEK